MVRADVCGFLAGTTHELPCKRLRSFCQKRKWQVTPKHAYTLDPTKSEWATIPLSPGIVWEPIRKRAHKQLVREHSVTVVSARWATVDWSWHNEWNSKKKKEKKRKKKERKKEIKKRRRGINCWTLSQNSRTRGKSHHRQSHPPINEHWMIAQNEFEHNYLYLYCLRLAVAKRFTFYSHNVWFAASVLKRSWTASGGNCGLKNAAKFSTFEKLCKNVFPSDFFSIRSMKYKKTWSDCSI